MRACVMEAVIAELTKKQLDTKANISVTNKSFAQKLKLKGSMNTGNQIDIQEIWNSKVVTTSELHLRILSGGRWSMNLKYRSCHITRERI